MSGADTIARQDCLRSLVEAAYPGSEPSHDICARIAAAARRADERMHRRHVLMTRLRWTTVAACTLALLAALPSLMPTLAAAAALHKIGAAMSDARSAHIVTWTVGEDGKRTKAGEDWYANGCWRHEQPDGQVTVFADHALWNYDPKANVAHVRRHSSGPFGYNSSGFSVKAMASDFARWGWTDRIRVLGETTVDGRRARKVWIERQREASRAELLVDTATDLPFQFNVQRLTTHGAVTERVSELTYNIAVPARSFVPDFGKTARVEDMEDGQKKWGARLAKGIASKRLGGRTIVIRDFQVNADGDVFLLYTAGSYWEVWNHGLELRDDSGTVYLRVGAGFEASIEHQFPQLPNGYVFGGERLHGAWWVPLERQSEPKDRRFTVTFLERSWRVRRGLSASVPGQTAPGVSFDIVAAGPSCSLVPEYMPYMALPLGDWNVAPWRADARARYCEDRLHDDPRALALYREELEAQRDIDLRTGNSSANPQAWYSIYHIERKLGHQQEARDALLHARDDLVYPNWPVARGIHRALKREGLE